MQKLLPEGIIERYKQFYGERIIGEIVAGIDDVGSLTTSEMDLRVSEYVWDIVKSHNIGVIEVAEFDHRDIIYKIFESCGIKPEDIDFVAESKKIKFDLSKLDADAKGKFLRIIQNIFSVQEINLISDEVQIDAEIIWPQIIMADHDAGGTYLFTTSGIVNIIQKIQSFFPPDVTNNLLRHWFYWANLRDAAGKKMEYKIIDKFEESELEEVRSGFDTNIMLARLVRNRVLFYNTDDEERATSLDKIILRSCMLVFPDTVEKRDSLRANLNGFLRYLSSIGKRDYYIAEFFSRLPEPGVILAELIRQRIFVGCKEKYDFAQFVNDVRIKSPLVFEEFRRQYREILLAIESPPVELVGLYPKLGQYLEANKVDHRYDSVYDVISIGSEPGSEEGRDALLRIWHDLSGISFPDGEILFSYENRELVVILSIINHQNIFHVFDHRVGKTRLISHVQLVHMIHYHEKLFSVFHDVPDRDLIAEDLLKSFQFSSDAIADAKFKTEFLEKFKRFSRKFYTGISAVFACENLMMLVVDNQVEIYGNNGMLALFSVMFSPSRENIKLDMKRKKDLTFIFSHDDPGLENKFNFAGLRLVVYPFDEGVERSFGLRRYACDIRVIDVFDAVVKGIHDFTQELDILIRARMSSAALPHSGAAVFSGVSKDIFTAKEISDIGDIIYRNYLMIMPFFFLTDPRQCIACDTLLRKNIMPLFSQYSERQQKIIYDFSKAIFHTSDRDLFWRRLVPEVNSKNIAAIFFSTIVNGATGELKTRDNLLANIKLVLAKYESIRSSHLFYVLADICYQLGEDQLLRQIPHGLGKFIVGRCEDIALFDHIVHSVILDDEDDMNILSQLFGEKDYRTMTDMERTSLILNRFLLLGLMEIKGRSIIVLQPYRFGTTFLARNGFVLSDGVYISSAEMVAGNFVAINYKGVDIPFDRFAANMVVGFIKKYIPFEYQERTFVRWCEEAKLDIGSMPEYEGFITCLRDKEELVEFEEDFLMGSYNCSSAVDEEYGLKLQGRLLDVDDILKRRGLGASFLSFVEDIRNIPISQARLVFWDGSTTSFALPQKEKLFFVINKKNQRREISSVLALVDMVLGNSVLLEVGLARSQDMAEIAAATVDGYVFPEKYQYLPHLFANKKVIAFLKEKREEYDEHNKAADFSISSWLEGSDVKIEEIFILDELEKVVTNSLKIKKPALFPTLSKMHSMAKGEQGVICLISNPILFEYLQAKARDFSVLKFEEGKFIFTKASADLIWRDCVLFKEICQQYEVEEKPYEEAKMDARRKEIKRLQDETIKSAADAAAEALKEGRKTRERLLLEEALVKEREKRDAMAAKDVQKTLFNQVKTKLEIYGCVVPAYGKGSKVAVTSFGLTIALRSSKEKWVKNLFKIDRSNNSFTINSKLVAADVAAFMDFEYEVKRKVVAVHKAVAAPAPELSEAAATASTLVVPVIDIDSKDSDDETITVVAPPLVVARVATPPAAVVTFLVEAAAAQDSLPDPDIFNVDGELAIAPGIADLKPLSAEDAALALATVVEEVDYDNPKVLSGTFTAGKLAFADFSNVVKFFLRDNAARTVDQRIAMLSQAINPVIEKCKTWGSLYLQGSNIWMCDGRSPKDIDLQLTLRGEHEHLVRSDGITKEWLSREIFDGKIKPEDITKIVPIYNKMHGSDRVIVAHSIKYGNAVDLIIATEDYERMPNLWVSGLDAKRYCFNNHRLEYKPSFVQYFHDIYCRIDPVRAVPNPSYSYAAIVNPTVPFSYMRLAYEHPGLFSRRSEFSDVSRILQNFAIESCTNSLFRNVPLDVDLESFRMMVLGNVEFIKEGIKNFKENHKMSASDLKIFNRDLSCLISESCSRCSPDLIGEISKRVEEIGLSITPPLTLGRGAARAIPVSAYEKFK